MSDGKQQVSDAVVEAIKASVDTKVIKVDETDFLTRQVYDPPKPSTVETLNIATLTGLVEFVKTQHAGALPLETDEPGKLIIQVESANSVAVKGPISNDRAKQRDVYARAVAQNPFAKGFQLGRYMALSDFNIALRTLFDTGGDRDALVALLGNVQGSKVAEGADDGFSQTVTVRRSVTKVGNEEVKNPVLLYPRRTFKEVMPTSSEFVLRLQSDDDDDPPTVALFAADGEEWEHRSITDIVAYLKENLPDEVVIG